MVNHNTHSGNDKFNAAKYSVANPDPDVRFRGELTIFGTKLTAGCFPWAKRGRSSILNPRSSLPCRRRSREDALVHGTIHSFIHLLSYSRHSSDILFSPLGLIPTLSLVYATSVYRRGRTCEANMYAGKECDAMRCARVKTSQHSRGHNGIVPLQHISLASGPESLPAHMLGPLNFFFPYEEADPYDSWIDAWRKKISSESYESSYIWLHLRTTYVTVEWSISVTRVFGSGPTATGIEYQFMSHILFLQRVFDPTFDRVVFLIFDYMIHCIGYIQS